MRRTCIAIAITLVAASPAHAQQRDTLRLRVHPDSIPIDSVVPSAPYTPPSPKRMALGTLGTVGWLFVFPLATGALAFFPEPLLKPGDTTETIFLRDGVRTMWSVGAGPGLGPWRRADVSGSAAVGFEVLTYGFVVDARWEHAWTPEHLELRTGRVGYLAHPRRGVMAGVMAGWRDTRGPRMVYGVDVGFPLVVGAKGGGWVRFEPSYVFPTHTLGPRRAFAFSYRMELVTPQAATRPWVPALLLEGRGFRENDGVVTVAAQFGAHTRTR